MNLLGKVEEVIRRDALLAPGMRVAVACSGGADSVALLLLLRELAPALGILLSVAHLNHQLRGAAADADEAFVRALAERLGLEFIPRRVDVAARAELEGANLEEAGRQARLEFFAALCSGGMADAVATAHTLDDQAETLLARLLRGTGLTGLAGIQPIIELERGRIVRPLLEVRRAELRAFLQERNQEWREDASNLDPARARNRIRLELTPQLERMNPSGVEHLAHLAAQARQEEHFWQVFIGERFRTLARQQEGEWRIAASQLLEPLGDFYSSAGATTRAVEAAQRGVAQRLVRRLLEAARGSTRQLTEAHVAQVLRLASSGQSGQEVVLPGLRVERSFDVLVFHAGRRPAASVSYSYEIPVPGSVDIQAAHQRLQFKLVAAGERPQVYNGVEAAALDADVLAGFVAGNGGGQASAGTLRLTVRNWRPGDRYQPAGWAHPKKLKTLFQRAQVPASERRHCPVVLSADRIVWTSRFGVAAGCAVGERTRTVLVIVEEPLPERH